MNDIVDTQSGTQLQGDATDFLPPGGRIVVGVDSSPASKVALRVAARIASLTGSTIEALGVWEFSPVYGYAEGMAEGMAPRPVGARRTTPARC
jgi:nucleotide-binding universal stress UspA family protein